MAVEPKLVFPGLGAVGVENTYVVGDDGKGMLQRHNHVNIGLAVDVDKGDGARSLVVPVLRDADRMSMVEIERGIAGLAQKAKDTMRIALAEVMPVIDSYFANHNDGSFYYREVYEPLIRYDDGVGKITPALAKSWKQIDDKTLEFEIRDDVKFHNVKQFTVDDIVYMIAAPTLVLRGEHTKFLSAEVAQRIPEVMADARLVTVPGSSGYIPGDRPKDFAREVDAFLTTVLGR